MKRTQTIEISFEKNETLVIRRRRSFFRPCVKCGRKVAMSSAEEAAEIGKTSVRKIYQKIETGEIHFVETPEGFLLICLDSLKS